MLRPPTRLLKMMLAQLREGADGQCSGERFRRVELDGDPVSIPIVVWRRHGMVRCWVGQRACALGQCHLASFNHVLVLQADVNFREVLDRRWAAYGHLNDTPQLPLVPPLPSPLFSPNGPSPLGFAHPLPPSASPRPRSPHPFSLLLRQHFCLAFWCTRPWSGVWTLVWQFVMSNSDVSVAFK